MLRILNHREFLTNLYFSFKTNLQRNMSVEVERVLKEDGTMIKNDRDQNIKRESTAEEIIDSTKKQKFDTFERIKRRNYVIMLGYLGKDYYGMQRNPGMKTVEEDLVNALLKAELITSTAFETIQTIRFQRAARTDKGVSAVRQVVSLKLPIDPDKESVNQHLPEEIRVFSIKRVTKGFNSKHMCDARTYSYTLPTYSFAPESADYFEKQNDFVDTEKRLEELSVIDGKPCSEYRVPPESLERVRNILKKFEGSHNFHNFTSKIKPLDPRAMRFIIQFDCGNPFIHEDTEFVTIQVKGQSFMMHQIRKMIGLAIGITRNNTSEDIFEQVFKQQKLDIPKAPGLGLVLNYIHYDYYNKRYGKDGVHEPLDWKNCETEVDSFLQDYILKHIIETELKEKIMLQWLANMPFHSFDVREENSETSELT